MDTQTLMASLASAASYEVVQTDLSSVAERITVDMDTRKITTNNSKFGNERDHLAKTKVLDITRYVGGMDLSTQTAALHWENGTNGGVYALTEVDLSEDGRMLYKWPLSEEFTQNVGAITFAVHLYTIKTGVLLYHISSDPYAGKIDKTFNATNHALETTPPSQIEECVQQMKDISAAIDEQVANVTALVKEAEEAAYNAALSAAQAANAAEAALDSKADAIVQTVSGTTAVATDSAEAGLAGMRVYGKSTQDGTPSPDAPVEIVSVGDDGSVEVGVYGKNLMSYPYDDISETVNGITLTDNGDGSVTADGTSEAYRNKKLKTSPFYLPKGDYILSGCPSGGSNETYSLRIMIDCYGAMKLLNDYGEGCTFSLSKSCYIMVFIYIASGVTLSNMVFKPMIRLAFMEDDTYATYKTAQSLPISRTLPGIPVTDESLATYTDADGQMWCADEVDLERGVYVQRVMHEVLTEDAIYNISNASVSTGGCYVEASISHTTPAIYLDVNTVISDQFISTSFNHRSESSDAYRCYVNKNENATNTYVTFRYPISAGEKTLEEAKADFAGTTIQYILATPIETALTDEELTAYAALHSNYPITSIISDAHTEVDYVADTKTYIDNKFAELAAAIVAGSEV